MKLKYTKAQLDFFRKKGKKGGKATKRYWKLRKLKLSEEAIFDAQVWTNYKNLRMKKSLDVASKEIGKRKLNQSKV